MPLWYSERLNDEHAGEQSNMPCRRSEEPLLSFGVFFAADKVEQPEVKQAAQTPLRLPPLRYLLFWQPRDYLMVTPFFCLCL